MIAKEPQNQIQLDNYFSSPPKPMGPWTSHIWRSDPRHLAFLLGRYKFVAKMLEGKGKVLEVGCGDAFGTPIVAQVAESVHGIDFEENLLKDNRARNERTNITFSALDLSKQVPDGIFQAAYSLDVIEHVPKEVEDAFMTNLCKALDKDSVLIIGTPNVTAKQYASEASNAGHINLKSQKELRELLGRYFSNVFMFSMNDEVVHTGFGPMGHYLLGMGVGKKAR